MLYCEICRVLNGWPEGVKWAPLSQCDLCHTPAQCYAIAEDDIPGRTGHYRIGLVPTLDHNFSYEQLIGPRIFKVLKILCKTPDRVVVEIDECDPLDPATEPLVVGAVLITHTLIGHNYTDYQPRALWDNRLWQLTDRDTEQFLELVAGMRPGSVAQFIEKLEESELTKPMRTVL